MSIEKKSGQENNKNAELEKLLKLYPLPEQFSDKAELVLKLKKMVSAILEKNVKNYDKMHDFGLKLRNKYRDASQYYLYNILIGSTGMKTDKFDFPGEDSVENFLKMLYLSSRLDD